VIGRIQLQRYPIAVVAAVGLLVGVALRLVFAAPRAADAVFLATLVLGGTPLVLTTLRGMLRGRFAADVVAMLAILTAVALGQYFAGAVIVLMQSGGEALEAYAMGRATDTLEALLERAPRIAHRLAGDVLTDVSVEAVRPGELLVVKPGELVPVDATVTEGTSSVDQSAVTGEPAPIRAVAGTALLSGTVNLDGVLQIRARRPAAQSQYQQIVRLVEHARLEKPPLQRLADRYAVWFTPLTLLMCGLAWVLTGDPRSVLAVLVVATPCPLILAVPVAVIAAISRAAERGIIVKHGSALEQVGLARIVVFDKTGTLTLGRPEVASVTQRDAITPDDLLRLAAAAEQLSANHLAQAVTRAGVARFGRLPDVAGFEEMPGGGVAARVEGRSVAVGSAAFHEARGTSVTARPHDGTTALIALDGRVVGSIEFDDRVRPEVGTLVERLTALGVRNVVMLTGDDRVPADRIARAVGIHEVRADLLPADKVKAVQELLGGGDAVVMVGDGINDAPALAAATVGIALGAHGTAVSAEAADIVLLVDDVGRVGDTLAISQRMRRVALQSIGVGLGVSFSLMVIASFGLVSPAVGALLQEALDAAVILNALRAR
jgi:heavy metal translocating P-type ATPase